MMHISTDSYSIQTITYKETYIKNNIQLVGCGAYYITCIIQGEINVPAN